MSGDAKQWQVTLHIVESGNLYQLTRVELKDLENELDFASESIADCAQIPMTTFDNPDSGDCFEIWAYAPGVTFDSGQDLKFVTLNETISFGYPRATAGVTPLSGEVIPVQLSGLLYLSDDPKYTTLELTGTSIPALPAVDDCQNIPAGDPVRCIKVFIDALKAEATDAEQDGVMARIGGFWIYYPRRRR
jgi:hypothetical protein